MVSCAHVWSPREPSDNAAGRGREEGLKRTLVPLALFPVNPVGVELDTIDSTLLGLGEVESPIAALGQRAQAIQGEDCF